MQDGTFRLSIVWPRPCNRVCKRRDDDIVYAWSGSNFYRDCVKNSPYSAFAERSIALQRSSEGRGKTRERCHLHEQPVKVGSETGTGIYARRGDIAVDADDACAVSRSSRGS